ncbi:DNA invertase Pin-like site-specific DNA recombinase [Bradyrhizobium diazoefficiens]
MNAGLRKAVRCAIYTRVSTEHGLDQEFNSLDAQHEAASAYIKSQAHAGWTQIRSRYDDGGYSGGSTDRPNLQKLLDDVRAHKIDVIVVYKVDRLTRSLADFAKLVELFDAHAVSFVSVTQQFNTTTSMGRLTLNVLLSFAQFEREVTSERIRDKIAASKRKGLWVGGPLPLGYEMKDGKVIVVEEEAERVRFIFKRYRELSGVNALVRDLRQRDIRTKTRTENGAFAPDVARASDRQTILEWVERIDVYRDRLLVRLKSDHPADLADASSRDGHHLSIPWQKPPSKRPRQILLPHGVSRNAVRPERAERRARLVAAIARGRRWLAEIVSGSITGVDQIASRERCSVRQVNMTISLAFLAPDLVKAAVEGRMPRGIGVERLREAPAEWRRQFEVLGLNPQ